PKGVWFSFLISTSAGFTFATSSAIKPNCGAFNADQHPAKGCRLVQFLAAVSTSSRGLPACPRNALACNRDAWLVFLCTTESAGFSWRFSPQNNPHIVSQRVVTQSHDFVGCRDSIQFYQNDTSGAVIWILDDDAINGVVETVLQTETRPIFRYDRVHRECVAAPMESQNFFEPDAIGPSCRASVPSPATAPDVAG